ncbi:YceI family protein [Mycobacterium sp. 3519A]|uniref:YceI family protein n=1 Tax=Mycobacterium sp. 3519A TaxID=2057184 RepID=UPI000C7A55A7|nr:YceI family protein [Mycobacterium sp. 3519A]
MSSTQRLLSNPATVGVWEVDPGHSTIGFSTKSMWGLATVAGRFTGFIGDGQITDQRKILGRIEIQAASLDTRLRIRDRHLRSAEYFDVQRFPTISVAVTGAEPVDADTVDLKAELTIKGTAALLPLRATVEVIDEHAVRLSTQATVDRNDFGVDGNLMGMLSDEVTISGEVVLRRQY